MMGGTSSSSSSKGVSGSGGGGLFRFGLGGGTGDPLLVVGVSGVGLYGAGRTGARFGNSSGGVGVVVVSLGVIERIVS